MALIKCHECGEQVSTQAKACPKCGAAVRKPTSAATWMIVGISSILVAMCVFSESESDKRAKFEAARVSQLTPEQKAREAKTKAEAKAREDREEAIFQKAQIAASGIRRAANDPSSISFYETNYTAAGAIVLYYRGKNAFNATIPNIAIVTPDGVVAAGAQTDRAIVVLFNKHIANQPLTRLPNPPNP